MPDQLGPGIRLVSALTPGVLGITGIETAEIIRGAVEKVSPPVLSPLMPGATNVGRICSTIQIADSGINRFGVGKPADPWIKFPGYSCNCHSITVVHAEIIM